MLQKCSGVYIVNLWTKFWNTNQWGKIPPGNMSSGFFLLNKVQYNTATINESKWKKLLKNNHNCNQFNQKKSRMIEGFKASDVPISLSPWLGYSLRTKIILTVKKNGIDIAAAWFYFPLLSVLSVFLFLKWDYGTALNLCLIIIVKYYVTENNHNVKISVLPRIVLNHF